MFSGLKFRTSAFNASPYLKKVVIFTNREFLVGASYYNMALLPISLFVSLNQIQTTKRSEQNRKMWARFGSFFFFDKSRSTNTSFIILAVTPTVPFLVVNVNFSTTTSRGTKQTFGGKSYNANASSSWKSISRIGCMYVCINKTEEI